MEPTVPVEAVPVTATPDAALTHSAAEPPVALPDAAPADAAPAADAAADTVDASGGVQSVVVAAHAPARVYPSLYDHTGTTLAAVLMGAAIVGSIQMLVVRMYTTAKSEHDYLTRFVTSLVAMVVGCYIADLLIAGPDTSLLSDDEHTMILTFIKDTALMIFSYYFGLKAQSPKDNADG
jgi:hypothetical protein